MRLLYHWSLVYILLLGSLLPLQTKARLLNKSKGTVTTPNPNGLASSSSSLLTSRRRQQRQRQQQPTWRRKKDADVPAVPIRASWKQDLVHRSKIGLYFALWYALNIIYNIVNKQVLNAWPAPLTVGTLQLGVGVVYSWLAWTLQLRRRPDNDTVSEASQKLMHTIGLCHAMGHLATTMSLGAGPVSFTHIVKAAEPLFSSAVSALWLGQYMPWPVYLTLLPVVGGVGYACLKERLFSWLAFGMAMASNLSFALRAVLSKVALSSSSKTTLSPVNAYALISRAGFIACLPFVLLGEGTLIWPTLQSALSQQSAVSLIQRILLSGLYLHLCNEVMFMALGSVHPITLAVGNTMKRVFVMWASVLVFGNVVTVQAAVGSAIGLAGVLAYSLTKQYYEKPQNKKLQ